MRRSWMILLVGLMAVTLLAIGGAAFWYERPTVLTVAVSRADQDDLALMTVAAAQLKRSHKTLRLHVMPAENSADAAAQIDAGKADLAVVRSDVAMPNAGQTVVILHRDSAIILAPTSSEIQALSDLQGHRLGMIGAGPGNMHLLEVALAQNDMHVDAVQLEPLQIADVTEALKSKRVDAVMAVDVVSGTKMNDLVKAVIAAGGGAPSFISVAEADAIAQRTPSYESTEIVRGTFGGAPPRPAEEFDTLSVTHRLVANENLEQEPIAGLTRFLLTERGSMAASVPLAGRIEAPSTDKGSALPVHPGAAAYIDDEEETFFDKYSDFIYIGAMLIGVLASGATALMSRMNSRRTAVLDDAIGRLVHMLSAARSAQSATELSDLQTEADAHLTKCLDAATSIDESRLRVFSLALDQVRDAIRDRQGDLAAPNPVGMVRPPLSSAAAE